MLPFLRQPDVYQRTMGWRALGEEALRLARRTGAVTVVAVRRDDVASLLYYLRDSGLTVLAWPAGTVPNHHFELTRRLTPAAGEPVLLISRCEAPPVAGSYRNVEPLGAFEARSGRKARRDYFAFRLSGAAPRSLRDSVVDGRQAMNRTGLLIALGAAAIVGIVFAVYPELDIAMSRLFYDSANHRWMFVGSQPMKLRNVAGWLVALIVAPAVIALRPSSSCRAGRCSFPRERLCS